MMNIETSSGFTCKVNEQKLKDWRYIRTSTKIARSTDDIEIINGIDFLFRFLLGDEQTDALIEHLCDDDGVVGTDVIINEFRSITALVSEQLKKSQSSQG